MQPKHHTREHFENFERAENTTALGALGDPERWGWSQTMKVLVPASQVPGIQAIPTSRQLVRAQAPDLIARQWLCFANFEFIVPGTSTVAMVNLTAQITAGVGQASFELRAQVFPGSNVQTPFSLASGGNFSTVELGRVPAVSIAIRFTGAVTVPVSVNPSLCSLKLSAFVAPRAL